MQEKGFMWDSIEGDRIYGSQDMADAFKGIMDDGIVDPENDFRVTVQEPVNGIVRISSGSAWIGGRFIKLDGYEDIELPRRPGSYYYSGHDGTIILKCRTDTEHRDFAFITKAPEGETYTAPEPEEGELYIANFKYTRGTDPSIGESGINQRLSKLQKASVMYSKSSPLKIGDDTDLYSGILKSSNYKIARAIPGEDYFPMTGGTIKGNVYPGPSPQGGLIPWIGDETHRFERVYANEGNFNSVKVGELNAIGSVLLYENSSGLPIEPGMSILFSDLSNFTHLMFDVTCGADAGKRLQVTEASGGIYFTATNLTNPPSPSTYHVVFEAALSVSSNSISVIGFRRVVVANGSTYTPSYDENVAAASWKIYRITGLKLF